VHARLKRLEDAGKPLIAAIHGHALGGGLEFAMACHYRVAVATAKMGQPEVQLGIIPGAGGTQRLPRLCGPSLALEMCTEGKPIPAARAAEAGILDAVSDADLLEDAIAFAKARAVARERRRTRDLQDRLSDRAAGIAACQATRAALGRAARGARAPFAAVDAIEACLTMDFDAGSRREIELFADCVLSVESKAMRHLFFAEREVVKIPDVPKDTPVRTWTRPRSTAACQSFSAITNRRWPRAG
jgi:3-hydroxyacyl-CoA dehydrogenase